MSARKIAALRALAERPGTEAEGAVAREKLAKLMAASPAPPTTIMDSFADTIRSAVDRCVAREELRAEIQRRFKPGDLVYYNRWAYAANEAGIVKGYPKPTTDNAAWLRIKFDRLKTARNVPIFSEDGWHLSHTPLVASEIGNLRGPMGTHGMETDYERL